MMAQRWKHFGVMFLIGDGMMAAVRPERAAKAWIAGPKFWRRTMKQLSRHPQLTRAIGVAETALGVWWAIQQEKDFE